MRLLLGSLLAAVALGFLGLGYRPAALEADSSTSAIATQARTAVTQKKADGPAPGGKQAKPATGAPAGAAARKAIQLQEWTAIEKPPACWASDDKLIPNVSPITVYAERKVTTTTEYFIVVRDVDLTTEQAKDLIAYIDKLQAI